MPAPNFDQDLSSALPHAAPWSGELLSLMQTQEGGVKGKPEQKGWETCFSINLRKKTRAGRDSLSCSSAFITPLPPDPRPLLDGRARLLGTALLMCRSGGKWLLMKGLKWYVENTALELMLQAPAHPGLCQDAIPGSFNAVFPLSGPATELLGTQWHASPGPSLPPDLPFQLLN